VGVLGVSFRCDSRNRRAWRSSQSHGVGVVRCFNFQFSINIFYLRELRNMMMNDENSRVCPWPLPAHGTF